MNAMKDYRVNKKEQPAYIIEAVPGTLTVQEKMVLCNSQESLLVLW